MSFDSLNVAFDVSSEIVSSEPEQVKPIQKEVDGIKFAFKTEIVTGPQTIVIEADQVIVNEEIADDFFN